MYSIWLGLVSGAVMAVAVLLGMGVSGAMPQQRRASVVVSVVVLAVVGGLGLWSIHFIA